MTWHFIIVTVSYSRVVQCQYGQKWVKTDLESSDLGIHYFTDSLEQMNIHQTIDILFLFLSSLVQKLHEVEIS